MDTQDLQQYREGVNIGRQRLIGHSLGVILGASLSAVISIQTYRFLRDSDIASTGLSFALCAVLFIVVSYSICIFCHIMWARHLKNRTLPISPFEEFYISTAAGSVPLLLLWFYGQIPFLGVFVGAIGFGGLSYMQARILMSKNGYSKND